MVKACIAVAALVVASSTWAQTGAQPQPYPQQPPAAQPPPAQQPPAQSQPPATAGSQGQSSAAQPGSPGASSQQVVVNPPPQEQPTVERPAQPPPSTTVVNPPPTYVRDDVVVERREPRNPMATVATDALYGGVAGLLVGFGITLVDEFDDWQRDIMVGAGIGLLAGAAVGVAHAAYDAREDRRSRRVALDGLNRTDRDPVVTARTVGIALRF